MTNGPAPPSEPRLGDHVETEGAASRAGGGREAVPGRDNIGRDKPSAARAASRERSGPATAGGSRSGVATPTARPSWIWIAVAFVGGLLAMAWVMTNLDRVWPGAADGVDLVAGSAPSTASPEVAALANSVDPVTGRSLATAGSVGAANGGAGGSEVPRTVVDLRAQVDALETRLASVRAAADGAAANSSRAEAILLAFAARRTLDRGVPLGFLQAQLRQRFPGQPRAVDTIVAAAANPVTVDSLRAALPSIAARSEKRFGGLFATVSGEGPPLIAVVRGDAVRQTPRSRLEDADAALGRGNVDAALALVGELPATDDRVEWVRSARRYIAARQALDVIETAAILQGGTSGDSGSL